MRRLVGVKAMAVLALIALPPLVIVDPYAMHLAVLAAIYALLASSLNLVMGYSGLLSLGHQAYFGIGAYASALLAMRLSVPPWIAVLLGGILAALAGRMLGTILLRLRSAYFVISTIAFAEIMKQLSINWVSLTQGPMGIAGVPFLSFTLPGGIFVDLSVPQGAYAVIAMVTAFSVFLIWRLVNSDVGRVLVAMREGENLAESLGMNTRRYALVSVVVGAFFAGIAGALYAHYIGFLSPDVFYFSLMVSIIVMVLAGGMGTIGGPILGAVLFTVVPELLRSSNEYRMLFYGIILVLLVRFAPAGIWPALERAFARAKRWSSEGERSPVFGPGRTKVSSSGTREG